MKLGSNGTSALQGLLQSPNLYGWRVQPPVEPSWRLAKVALQELALRFRIQRLTW